MWYLYICEKKSNLYTGITTDLDNRMRQHGYIKPLYVEKFQDKRVAAKREREIKGWRRDKKIELIESENRTVSLP